MKKHKHTLDGLMETSVLARCKLSRKGVSKRVRAQLNRDRTERKRYRNDKTLRACAVAAALCLIISATAFAAYSTDFIGQLFRGNTDILQTERPPQSIVVDDFVFTVHQVIADEQNAYLIVSLAARTEAGKAAMKEPAYVNEFWLDLEIEALPGASVGINGYFIRDMSGGDEYTDYFYIRIGSYQNAEKSPVLLRLKGQELVIPMDTGLDYVSREIGATVTDIYGNEFIIQRVSMTPISTNIELEMTADGPPVNPPVIRGLSADVFFRLTDGSIVTLRQLGGLGNGGYCWLQARMDESSRSYSQTLMVLERDYYEVFDISTVAGVIVDGLEYSMEGRDAGPTPATVPEALRQFTMDLHMPDPEAFDAIAYEVFPDEYGGYYFGMHQVLSQMVPISEVCDAIGAGWSWDETTQSLSFRYCGQTVSYTRGEDEGYDRLYALEEVDGVLYCDHVLFDDLLNVSFHIAKLHWDTDAPSRQLGWVVTP